MITHKSLTEHQVAEALGLSVQTLRNWRSLRKGPAYTKYGRAVRYLEPDLQKYQDAKRIETQDAP